jgi:hypothetical protein
VEEPACVKIAHKVHSYVGNAVQTFPKSHWHSPKPPRARRRLLAA